jgi:hypothetical protein
MAGPQGPATRVQDHYRANPRGKRYQKNHPNRPRGRAHGQTGASNGRSCILDIRVLQKSAGSLVVEATRFAPYRSLQVHSAGVRTSDRHGRGSRTLSRGDGWQHPRMASPCGRPRFRRVSCEHGFSVVLDGDACPVRGRHAIVYMRSIARCDDVVSATVLRRSCANAENALSVYPAFPTRESSGAKVSGGRPACFLCAGSPRQIMSCDH